MSKSTTGSRLFENESPKPLEFDNKYEHHAKLKETPLTPFSVRKSGLGTFYSCNWHESIEILHITNGEGYIRYDAETLPLEKGRTVIINSKAMHQIHSENGIGFYTFIIDLDFFRENGIDTEKLTFEKYTDSEETARVIIQSYDRVKSHEKDGGFLSSAKIRECVLSMIIYLCEKHSFDKKADAADRRFGKEHVRKAMLYINDYCRKSISLEEIAEKTGVNKSYLAREFKKYTGQTVHTYINILRCQMADQCMASGMSVTQTALSCGFETLSYFSRTYKKLRGISPVEAKDKLQKAEIYH